MRQKWLHLNFNDIDVHVDDDFASLRYSCSNVCLDVLKMVSFSLNIDVCVKKMIMLSDGVAGMVISRCSKMVAS
jgi:hypothetical protein